MIKIQNVIICRNIRRRAIKISQQLYTRDEKLFEVPMNL